MPAGLEQLDLPTLPRFGLGRIGLASYIYSLDGTTTYNYLAFATSAFDKHSLISTIQVAQSVIGKPYIRDFLVQYSLDLV